jgi:probable HAF family extracellular repeat protein
VFCKPNRTSILGRENEMTRKIIGASRILNRATIVGLAVATALAVGLAGFVTQPADAAESTYYNVTSLDALWTGSIARDINESGKIAGQGQNPTGQARAFLWEGGQMKDLGVPAGGNLSRARSINGSGDVVGEWRILVNRQQRFKAFLWEDGQMKDLNALISAGSGWDLLGAQAINESGEIVGSGTINGQTHAFLYEPDTESDSDELGTATDLGTPLGDPFSEAWGINDADEVVGESGSADGGQAFLYDDGTVDRLGALLDHSVHPYSEAMNLNDSGQVVGWSYTLPATPQDPPRGRAFLYDTKEAGEARLQPLDPLPGDLYSRARDIDESGLVVGWSRNDTGANQEQQFSAVLWEAGHVKDLNDLIPADSGWKLTDAYSISERGQIVGSGFKGDELQAFLLTPDTTPPELRLPDDIAAEATSKDGAEVTYAATATDENPTKPEVSCTHPSGSTFALGEITVTCTATDKAGNQATGTFNVTVTYSWSGVLQPINADGSSVFKSGRTVPVKLELTGKSAGITDAESSLHLSEVSESVAGTQEENLSAALATGGNLFRYDPAEDQYIFNLSTRDLSQGTYRLRVDLGDGLERTVIISLR